MCSRFLQSFIGSFIIISSLQGVAEVRAIDPYPNSMMLQKGDTDISIERIEIVNSPSEIMIHHCDDLANCSPTEVLDSKLAVEVSFRYINQESSREDGGIIYSSVRFPLQFFSKSELQQITQKSDFFLDPLGRKTSELKKLAQQLINHDIQPITLKTETLNETQTGCNYMMADSEFSDDYVCSNPKYVATNVDSKILRFFVVSKASAH